MALMAMESAKAQVTISSVAFSSNPNDCSNTSVTVSGLHYCSNYAFLGSNVSISGSTITVSINYTEGFVCLPAIVSYSNTVNLGTLPAGNYSVTINTYLNSNLSNTSSGNALAVISCCNASAAFTFSDDTICPGDTVIFTGASTGQSSDIWLLDNVTISASQNVSVGFPTAGTYDVSLVAVGDSCSDTTTHTIYVSPLPDAYLGNDTTICEGQAAVFSVPGGQGTYLWSDGTTGASNTLNTVGTLSLTVTNDIGCEATDAVSVLAVELAAHPGLGNDTAKCPGIPVTLDAGATWQGVLWSTGDTTATVNVTNAGSYWVEVWAANGCPGRDTINVSDHVIATLDIDHDPDLCGHATLYTATPFAGYNWSTLALSDTITVYQSGTYSLTVTDGNGCSQDDSLTVDVLEIPAVNLGNDTFICSGQNIPLTANVTGTYLWNNGSTASAFLVTQVGTYWLAVTSAEGCTGRDTIEVGVCAGVQEIQNDLEVFPVPASDHLVIRSGSSLVNAELRLFGLDGTLVYVEQLRGNEVRVNVESLPAGQYVLQINTPSGTHVQRVSVLK